VYKILVRGRGETFDLTPCCVGDVIWTTFKCGNASSLEFTVGRNMGMSFSFFEGNLVQFFVDGRMVFLGYVFSKERTSDHFVKTLAYDQLRYLKNRDTYNYSFKTASEVVSMIAADFGLNIGQLDHSGYVIANRIEENKTLFDIILNAVDLTFKNTGKYFVLFDKEGKLFFKALDALRLPFALSANRSNIIDFNCKTDIDSDTFSKVKLFCLNKTKKINRSFVVQSTQGVKDFGVLQYFEKMPDEYNEFQLKNCAEAILKEKNRITRAFNIECLASGIGEEAIRGGCGVYVNSLDIGEEVVSGFMTVSKCVHSFRADKHTYRMWF